jgi:protein gp37
MADSKIEWTDKVWNPVTGCTKVSQGCKNCYAERVFPRAYGTERKFTDVRSHPERLDAPLHWKKPCRVFVNSMSDLFHESVPFEFILAVLAHAVSADWHTYQILTKRPRRALEFFEWMDTKAPYRVEVRRDCFWWLVSIEDQPTADERIPLLIQFPVSVRGVSAEPTLGPIDLTKVPRIPLPGVKKGTPLLHWVVCGGESGPKARPMHPDWARSLRDQCQDAGVPFFLKQWGEWRPYALYGNFNSYADRVRRTAMEIGTLDSGRAALLNADGSELKNGGPDGKVYPIAHFERVGKKAAGRLLDGREWNEYPRVQR